MNLLWKRSIIKDAFGLKKILKNISISKMEAFPIEPYQIGERLDRYIKKSSIGWASGQKLLRKKQIVVQKIDGTIVNVGDYKFQQGDTLMISRIFKQKFGKNQPIEQRSVPRQQATRILNKMLLFDNQHISILNKLPGYSVQGGPIPKQNIFTLMSSKYKKQLIHITHRLDRCTTGLVLVAKNKQIAQLVQTSMEERTTFSKFYLALTQGNKIVSKSGYIRCNVEWTGKNKARLCNQTEENSKDCITFYAPISTNKCQDSKQKQLKQQKYWNLLGIKLLTGRKHQIRCHLSSYLQQPILNDSLYGGPKLQEFKQEEPTIFLHAFAIQIRKKQLIQKFISNQRYILNKQLGSMSVMDNKILFTANIPSYWNSKIKTNPQQLPQIAQKIQNIQKQSQAKSPKKRNVSKII